MTVKEPMLARSQQKRVWEGMLSAEIRANYFADLSGRYRLYQRAATGLTFFFSSGAFATFVVRDGPAALSWIRPLLALLAAAVSAYSFVAQNQDRAINSVDLHARWNKLAKEYEALWENMYAEDAPRQLERLSEKETELSKSGAAFPNDEKKMLRWQRHVEQQHRTVSLSA